MKKLVTFVFMISSAMASAQSSDTLFVSKLSDMTWTKNYSNSTQFKFIKFEDGSCLGIGDKMKFGTPSGINQSSTQQTGLLGSNGTLINVNNFTYMILGRMGMAVMGGVTYLPESFKGREAPIENIKIYRSKKNGIPSQASIIFQNPGMHISVFDLKFALEYGELINPKAAMTSEQALVELKKAKDKLDLGLIAQQHFDSLRTVLSKFIK
jgi:hypothetical protein